MKFHTQLPLAALCVATLFSTPAFAAKSATASVNNFGFKLIDLTPNDGIAPSLVFKSIYGDLFSGLNSATPGPDVNVMERGVLDNLQDRQVNVSSSAIGGNASSGISGNNFFSTGQLGDSHQSNFYSSQRTQVQFELSANTKLVLFGTLNTEVHDNSQKPNTGQWHNFASSYSNIRLQNSTGTSTYEATSTASSTFENDLSNEVDFSFNFYNRNANATTGSFEMYQYVNAFEHTDSTPPIPEPETYALMLSGLAIMTVFARRRAAKRAI